MFLQQKLSSEGYDGLYIFHIQYKPDFFPVINAFDNQIFFPYTERKIIGNQYTIIRCQPDNFHTISPVTKFNQSNWIFVGKHNLENRILAFSFPPIKNNGQNYKNR